MATYSRLLIETGSGIVDHGKQSAKDPGASLIIGLGGTGSDLAIKLKKEVFKQLKPDDLDAPIPEHKNIKFLVVDSDDSKVRAQNGLVSDIEKSEYFDISNRTIKGVFAARDILNSRPELFWLEHENISIEDAGNGAGGIRQVGRFLLVDRAEQLYNKIKSSMQSALVGTNGKLHVHICAGISGGTGSGTFLDICYLVRRALTEIGKPESSVCGYFFLPDINLSVPAVANDPLISRFVKANGYAALQELDYCMNFARNADSFRMNYGFTTVDDRQRPVDLCYLISSIDASGKQVENSYQYAMGVVTDFIISYLAQVKLPEGANPDSDNEGMTLEGHISNLESIKGGIQLRNGANVNYNILGASVAEMPLSEIATYLGAKLFEKYGVLLEKTPTEKDLDEFIQHTQLGYDSIKKEVNKGCLPQLNFPDGFDARAYKQSGNAAFVKRADEFLAKNTGLIQENVKNLLDELKGFEISENSTSLISRTYKALCDLYATKLDFGPFFAQRLLAGGNNKNLIHKIDGYISRNRELLDAELRQAELRDDEYKSAKLHMESSNLLNEGARMKEYKNALNNLYTHHYRVELYQQIGTVLQKYKEQVVMLNNNYFSILTNILATLKNTFEENIRILTEGRKERNRYNWKIVNIPDIQEVLDSNIENVDVEQTLYRLISKMLKNVKLWINNDENNITKLISEFVLSEFREATQKTITDYLSQKYQVTDPVMLAKRIEKEIFEDQLENLSVPLFWQNGIYNNEVGKRSTITVPFDAASIISAAENYKNSGKGEFTIRKSGITDKISMMRFYSGFALYTYQGIQELESAYFEDKRGGKHLYAREEDWNKKIPSPIPDSFNTGRRGKNIQERNDKIKVTFEKAREQGIVVEDAPAEWFIRKLPAFDPKQFVKEMGGYVTNGKTDAVKAKKIVDALIQKMQELKENAERIRIQSANAASGCEYQVMMDFYCEAPVLNEMVERQLEQYDAINATIEQISEAAAVGSQETKIQKEFFLAIFTGVLSYGKSRIVYAYNQFGMDKEVVLQNSDMELAESGAFCAFETYKTLDSSVRKMIVEETKKRIDADECAEVENALRDLTEKMPLRIQTYMMRYDESTLEHEPIARFYEEFMKEMEIFKMSQI